jgi:hypothetical protein
VYRKVSFNIEFFLLKILVAKLKILIHLFLNQVFIPYIFLAAFKILLCNYDRNNNEFISYVLFLCNFTFIVR